jgi:hypothetical protein
MLPRSRVNYKTVHQRIQRGCENEVIRIALRGPENLVREQGSVDQWECYIDGTIASAKDGGGQIRPPRRGKFTKVAASRRLASRWRSGRTFARSRWCKLSPYFYMFEAKRMNFIEHKSYDSDALDEPMHIEDYELVSSPRAIAARPIPSELYNSQLSCMALRQSGDTF